MNSTYHNDVIECHFKLIRLFLNNQETKNKDLIYNIRINLSKAKTLVVNIKNGLTTNEDVACLLEIQNFIKNPMAAEIEKTAKSK